MRTVALSALLILGLVVTTWQLTVKEPLQEDSRFPRSVGAHYYLWYPHNFRGWMFLRGRLTPQQVPELGVYHSDDPKVVEQHIAWASEYGIDFFTLDWWRRRPQQNQIIDDVFLKARNISDIQFCIFYEAIDLGVHSSLGTVYFNKARTKAFVSDIAEIAERYFSHPQYLRVNGRPVLFIYVSRIFAGDYLTALKRAREAVKEKGYDVYLIGDEVFWDTLKDRGKRPKHRISGADPKKWAFFDALTNYNLYHRKMPSHEGYASESSFIKDSAELYTQFLDTMEPHLKLIPSIIPRYNDRGVRLGVNNYAIPPQFKPGDSEGTLFSHMIDTLGLPFMDEELGMLLITSWNEWSEGTAIEPLTGPEATRRDTTPSGKDQTQGYLYEPYGTRYLEILRDKVIAVAGRTNAKTVTIKKEGHASLTTEPDMHGHFRFSRRAVTPGSYTLSAQSESIPIVVSADKTTLRDISRDSKKLKN